MASTVSLHLQLRIHLIHPHLEEELLPTLIIVNHHQVPEVIRIMTKATVVTVLARITVDLRVKAAMAKVTMVLELVPVTVVAITTALVMAAAAEEAVAVAEAEAVAEDITEEAREDTVVVVVVRYQTF